MTGMLDGVLWVGVRRRLSRYESFKGRISISITLQHNGRIGVQRRLYLKQDYLSKFTPIIQQRFFEWTVLAHQLSSLFRVTYCVNDQSTSNNIDPYAHLFPKMHCILMSDIIEYQLWREEVQDTIDEVISLN